MTAPTIQDILECVYNVASGVSKYGDMVSMIAERYPDARVALVTAKQSTHSEIIELAYAGFDESFAKSYIDYYQFINIWTQTHFCFSPAPKIFTTRDETALPVQQILYRSEFYNDWVRPQDDMSEGLAIMLGGTEGSRIAVTCNLPRLAADELLPQIASDLTTLLQPLVFSLRTRLLMGEIQIERSNFEAALEFVPSAACVISGEGKVIHANSMCLELFRQGTELQLKASGEVRFRLIGQTSTYALGEMLGSGFASTGTAFLLERPNKRPLVCTITLLGGFGQPNGPKQPKYLLIISDPEALPELPSVELVSKYLGLSLAEARIAHSLAQGGRTSDIAQRLKLSPNTVRNQISAVLAKTGCERQADVATLVMSLGRVNSYSTSSRVNLNSDI